MKSIIIPLYFADLSQYQTIQRCFDSLMPRIAPARKDAPTLDIYETDFERMELIVVNDASPIDVTDFPVALKHNTNMGYTRTVNDGLKMATGDTLIIANQDIVFTPELLEKFNQVNFGIYSPKTSDEGLGDKFGAIWAMSRKVFDLLGPLDEQFAAYFSDADYYTRAKEAGVPIIKWPIVVEHEGNNAYKYVAKEDFYRTDMETYRRKHERVD